MSTQDVRTTVSVHADASAPVRVDAYERPHDGYGRAFVAIGVGDAGTEVVLMIRNPAMLDRLMDAVADARTGLLRASREADVRQPELLAS